MNTRLQGTPPPTITPPVYTFPEQEIIGSRDSHVILCIPESLPQEHLASLLLFYDTLLQNAEQEDRNLYITLHFAGKKPTTPVRIAAHKQTQGRNVVRELIEQNLDRSHDIRTAPSKEVARNASTFTWQQLEPVFAAERQQFTPSDHSVTFVFFPDGQAVPTPPQDREVVAVRFPKDHVVYPFVIDDTKASAQTRALTAHTRPLSPCAMHRRFVHMLGEHRQHAGKALLARLYAAPHNKAAFIFQNANRTVLESSNTLDNTCDATFAFETSGQLYFPAGGRKSQRSPAHDPLFIIEDRIRGIQFVSLESLLLYHEQQDDRPAPFEVIGQAAGYWELLVDQHRHGDTTAASHLLRHALPLLAVIAHTRTRQPKATLPHLETSFPLYLRELHATPSDLVSGLFRTTRFRPEVTRALDAMGTLRGIYGIKMPFYNTKPYQQYIKAALAPLIHNMQSMNEKQLRDEIDTILKILRSHMANIFDGNKGLNNGFHVAFDIIIDGLAHAPQVKQYFIRELVDAIQSVPPSRISNVRKPNLRLAQILTQLAPHIDSHSAKVLLTWSLQFPHLERSTHGTFAINLAAAWQILVSKLEEKDRIPAQRAIMNKAVIVMTDHAPEFAQRNMIEIWGHHKNLHRDSFAKRVLQIMNADIAGEFLGRLANQPTLHAMFDDAILPSLKLASGRRSSERDYWSSCVQAAMQQGGDVWRLIPDILHNTHGFDHHDILRIVTNTMNSRSEWTTLRDSDEHYTKLMLHAIATNNATAVLHHFEWWQGRQTAHSAKVDRLLQGNSLSRRLQRNILRTLITRVKQGTDLDSLARLFQVALSTERYEESSLRYAYNDAILGPLWQDAFFTHLHRLQAQDATLRAQGIQLLASLAQCFPRLSTQRKLHVINTLISHTQQHGPSVAAPLLAAVLMQIRYYGTRSSKYEPLLASRPLFALCAQWARQGHISMTSGDLPNALMESWSNSLYGLPFSEQLFFFDQIIGPFAAQAAKHQVKTGDVLSKLLKPTRTHDAKHKGQLIGAHLSRSPFLGLMFHIFQDRFTLEATEYVHLLNGFADAVQKNRTLLGKVEVQGFFAHANLYFHEHYRNYFTKAYSRFMQTFLETPRPPQILDAVLAPLRNKPFQRLQQYGWGLARKEIKTSMHTLQDLCMNTRIPLSTRAYLWHLLRQYHDDIASIPQLHSMRADAARMYNTLKAHPSFAEIQQAWEQSFHTTP